MMIKRLKAGLSLLLAALLDLLSRWSGRRAGLALVYHRVGAPESREHHLVAALDAELFEAQLRHLKRRYRVVPASELAGAVEARRRGQRFPVSITFDDDLPSHAGVAMPVLRRVGVPSTFFLTGGSLAAPFAFWWERLQIAFDQGLLEPDELREWAGGDADPSVRPAIRTVARAIEAMPAERRERVAETLLERLGADPPDAGLRAEDVRALADAGFEIGFHTLRHDPLPQLGAEELSRAMADGRAELDALLPSPITMISYPHGKADARVAQAAREAGYRFGFTTSPEPLRDDTNPLVIDRLYPAYDSLGRFALEVSATLRIRRR
jgi:peptidoglycan/xylan/chitin deacetylase (PgdA/CDA1 family)